MCRDNLARTCTRKSNWIASIPRLEWQKPPWADRCAGARRRCQSDSLWLECILMRVALAGTTRPLNEGVGGRTR